MFTAGVPLVEAMESVAKAAKNIVFTDGILQMRDQVATGQALNLTMIQSNLFPPMATQMVKIGEESGALDSMCAKVADYYEAEVDGVGGARAGRGGPGGGAGRGGRGGGRGGAGDL